MDSDCTEVPIGFDNFNPHNERYILFNLRFEGMEHHGELAMLQYVWGDEELPRRGSVIQIGAGENLLEIKIPRRNWLTGSDPYSRYESREIVSGALLHIKSEREFLEKVAALIAAHPEFEAKIHGSLHILAAVHMKTGEWIF